MLTRNLIARIKLAYPTGSIDDPDENAYESADRDTRLRNTLNSLGACLPLEFFVDPFDKPAYKIAITQLDHPEFGAWIFQMSNSEKFEWIKVNGQPYPVLWLKVSRIADYFYYYYNHWVPRGDTGYLDADFKREPNVLWQGYEKAIHSFLERNGFSYFTDEHAREKVSFVLAHDYASIPDDDPRWDDDNFEPPLVECFLDEILFKH